MQKEFITLNTFIKIKFLIPTGGQAKVIIRSGAVKVNNELETRNKKKLIDNDIVEYNGKKFTVSLKDW